MWKKVIMECGDREIEVQVSRGNLSEREIAVKEQGSIDQ